MRFLLALALLVFLATPAHACKCTPDTDGSRAQKVLNDPSISVVDAFIRVINPKTRYAVMDVKQVHSGGLALRYLRAKFGTTSCDVRPVPGQTMTMLIKNEPDGTYSLLGGCAREAILQKMK